MNEIIEEAEFGESVEGENLDIAEKIKKTGKELAISPEQAEIEFESWAEQFRIDTDTEKMDAEEKQDFKQIKNRFIYCLTRGITAIEENGDLKLHLIDPVDGKDTMIFRKKFKGAAFVAMDRYKDSQNVHKTLAFLGAWVNWNPKLLTQLDAMDTWFGMKMVSLFLGG